MTYFMTTLTRCAHTHTQTHKHTNKQTDRPSCRVDLALWAGSTKKVHRLEKTYCNLMFCPTLLDLYRLVLPKTLQDKHEKYADPLNVAFTSHFTQEAPETGSNVLSVAFLQNSTKLKANSRQKKDKITQQ